MAFKIRKIVVLEFPQGNHLLQRSCWAVAFHPALPFLNRCSPHQLPAGTDSPYPPAPVYFCAACLRFSSPPTVSQGRSPSLSPFSSALEAWL